MLGRLLTCLYSHLLKLYPDRFLDEFGGEMGDVFSQALSGLDDSDALPTTRRLKMVRLFFREVWYFPLAYLDAQRYQASLGSEDASLRIMGEQDTTVARVGRRASWGEALIGALPFLLYGLAHLLEGVAELGGYDYPVFRLLDGSLNRPAITLTAQKGVFFVSALGLLFGAWKGFPRWSYAYLGMSLYFGWSYNNQNYYGVFYKWWVWLPSFGTILLGLLLARSLKPLARLLQGAWNDWTRLTFALYAFALPMLTVIFFDDDWGVLQLYSLVFDTVLLAAGAVVFLRSRTTWGRFLSLLVAFLILVLKGFREGWVDGHIWPMVSFTLLYLGLLLLPGVIGLLRGGVNALTSR